MVKNIIKKRMFAPPAGQDLEPGRKTRRRPSKIDATRHELPENEIYAMNQKVGNQNTMI